MEKIHVRFNAVGVCCSVDVDDKNAYAFFTSQIVKEEVPVCVDPYDKFVIKGGVVEKRLWKLVEDVFVIHHYDKYHYDTIHEAMLLKMMENHKHWRNYAYGKHLKWKIEGENWRPSPSYTERPPPELDIIKESVWVAFIRFRDSERKLAQNIVKYTKPRHRGGRTPHSLLNDEAQSLLQIPPQRHKAYIYHKVRRVPGIQSFNEVIIRATDPLMNKFGEVLTQKESQGPWQPTEKYDKLVAAKKKKEHGGRWSGYGNQIHCV